MKCLRKKVKDVVGLYMNPPDNAIILCVDEKSKTQALERTQPLLPLRENIPAGKTTDYERRGTTTLFAALNVLTGEVVGSCKEHHKAKEYVEFLKEVDKKCEKGKEPHIIADKYSTHKSREVKELVAVIKEYIEEWNKNRKPFKWIKSATDIL
jgi:transposase